MAQIDGGSFGPERMWPLLAAVAVVLLGWKLIAPAPEPERDVALLNVIEHGVGRVEKITRSACERSEGRVWVTLDDGVECISYVSAGNVTGAGSALVFLNGDVPDDRIEKHASAASRVEEQGFADRTAQRFGVPVIIIGRPGLMGSTGFHMPGGMRDEAMVINGALAALRERFRLRQLALAGQSGGARIVAQLMVLGQHDIVCAAMGSGAFDVPRLRGGGTSRTDVFGDPGRRYLVPMLEVGRIGRADHRRTFVIGDTDDTVTPFPEQRAWAEKLSAAGHHARLIEANAKDLTHHGMARQAIAAAALCARGRSDEEIVSAVRAL